MPIPNRRSFFRHSMSAPITVQAAGIRTSIPATLVDISGGGCSIVCRMQFRSGTSLRFELLTLDGRLTLAGTIRLARYSAVDRSFSYGIEFHFVDERVRDQLVRVVNAERTRSRSRLLATQHDPRTSEERTPRVRADFSVEYTVDGATGLHHGFATDVSLGGMRLETDRALRPEQRLRIYFSLPGGDGLTVGVVAHALPGIRTRNTMQIHRVRFDDVDGATAQELERYIALNLTLAPRSPRS